MMKPAREEEIKEKFNTFTTHNIIYITHYLPTYHEYFIFSDLGKLLKLEGTF